MSDLIVDLVSPTGIVYKNTKIPESMTIREIIGDMIEQIGEAGQLGKLDSSAFGLRLDKSTEDLPADKTLFDAGIKPGERLFLFSYRPLESIPLERSGVPPAWRPAVKVNDLEVVLSVNREKNDRITLDADLEIGEIITYLREKYELPIREYVLHSLYCGRSISPTETLRSAGIPQRDHLSLFAEEVAGGAPPAMRNLNALTEKPPGRGTNLPREIEHFLDTLEEWAIINQSSAKWDSIKFWSLKVPAIIGASCTGVIASLHLSPTIPAILGTMSAVFVALDGLVRPGVLHSVHTRAFHDIRSLEMSVVHQCSIRRLEGEDGPRMAAKILGDAEKKRLIIASYLRDVEADAYSPSKHSITRRR